MREYRIDWFHLPDRVRGDLVNSQMLGNRPQ